APETVYAHELGHQLGFVDEYFDPESLDRSDPESVADDGSLMGAYDEGGEVGLRDRHLQQLQDDIQRTRATADVEEWERLRNEAKAVADGIAPYDSLSLDEAYDRLTSLARRIKAIQVRNGADRVAMAALRDREPTLADRARTEGEASQNNQVP